MHGTYPLPGIIGPICDETSNWILNRNDEMKMLASNIGETGCTARAMNLSSTSSGATITTSCDEVGVSEPVLDMVDLAAHCHPDITLVKSSVLLFGNVLLRLSLTLEVGILSRQTMFGSRSSRSRCADGWHLILQEKCC